MPCARLRPLLFAGLAVALQAHAETLTLPAAASIVGGSPFFSDVRAFNTSYDQSLDVLVTYRCFVPSPCAVGRPQFQIRLEPRESRAFDDMVVSEFQAPNTAGGVEFSFEGAATDLVVTSRLFSTSPTPTVGMFIPAMHGSRAHATTVLTSIRHDPGGTPGGFRTNAGVFNPNARTAVVTFTIFEDEIALGAPVTRSAPAHSGIQVSGIFEAAGAGDVSTQNAVIVVSATEPLFSYAAVIDNATSDPIFVVGANDGPGAVTPTPTGPTSTPSRTPTFEFPTLTPTTSGTPTRTLTPGGPTLTPSATRTLTPTGPTATPSMTFTPSRTFTPSLTFTPSRTFTPSLTFTITQTPTTTRTPTQTQTLTRTPTPSRTLTPTVTSTATQTLTPTQTSTSTLTATGTQTSTRTPTVTRTPTLTATPNPNHIVFVGQGGTQFVDSISGTSNTTITAGETIEWVWSNGLHSTTSGTCVGTNCTPDNIWNSGNHGPPFTFTRAFPTANTFSYYCMIHGSMMQGAINVLPPP